MPNQPKTPHRTIRVPDDLWEAAQVKASREGVTVSDVVRRALTEYVFAGDEQVARPDQWQKCTVQTSPDCTNWIAEGEPRYLVRTIFGGVPYVHVACAPCQSVQA